MNVFWETFCKKLDEVQRGVLENSKGTGTELKVSSFNQVFPCTVIQVTSLQRPGLLSPLAQCCTWHGPI